MTERNDGAAGDSAREGGCGTRERPIWIGDREREAAGGRKGGDVGFGEVFFFLSLHGRMDGRRIASNGW